MLPVFRQGRQQRARAEKSRRHADVVAGDFFCKHRRNFRPLGLGNQPDPERHHIGRLRIDRERAVGFAVVFVKHRLRLGSAGAVVGCFDRTPNGFSHFGHQRAIERMETGVEIIDGRRLFDVEPITPRIAQARAESLGRGAGLTPRHKSRHRRPMPFEQPRVAVRFPNRPRTNNPCIRPARAEIFRGRPVRHRIRRVVGISAKAALRLRNVVAPLGEKCGDVGIKRGGADISLSVAHPTETFITLRAVGGDFHEVGALGPLGVFPKLREHRIAAFKITREWRVVVQHKTRDGIERGALREAREFHVLKPVIGETRRPRFARCIPA